MTTFAISQIIEQLIANTEACLLNSPDTPYGQTPLHLALQNRCRPETISSLIRHGADVHVANLCGEPPLMLSTDAAVTRLLLDAGAAVNVRCLLGSTVLHIAA
jgi:ankyrin repeat protein